MKNLLPILFLLIISTGCSTGKHSSGLSSATVQQPQKPASRQSSPKFINTISINNPKDAGSKNNSVTTVPSVTNEITNESSGSPETLRPVQFKYAILMDMPVEDMVDLKLLEFLESWYGTPYRMGGTTKSGVDCSAFVQSFMMTMYDISLPRTSKEQHDRCVRIHKKELKEGDLVFFYTQGHKEISHVGVYLRNNKFVHASTSWGVMISDLNEEYYSKGFAGAGRLAKLNKYVSRVNQ